MINDTPKNSNRVLAKVWKSWSIQARQLFNNLYEEMANQSIYLHPKATPAKPEHWKTVRWNAAWVAAELVDHPGEPFEVAD